MAARKVFRNLLHSASRVSLIGAHKNSRKLYVATGVMLISGAGIQWLSAKKHVASAAERLLAVDRSMFMSEPITDIETLKNSDEMYHHMETMITKLQADFCKALESHEDTSKFKVDRWLKKEGKEGGGITCVMEDGSVFERAAVNISVINGKLTRNGIKLMNSSGKSLPEDEDELPFKAVGISSVIHPRNPMVPTLHFNYRYFEVQPKHSKCQWWFGGGTDLTPYYMNETDFKHFHKTLKAACDKHSTTYYQKFKKWCDDYFYLPHRAEGRGIGGIFFDDVRDQTNHKCFNFVKSCADSVIPSFLPLVQKHKNDGYGLKERNWQLLRRGRYVEFNLVYDRGTKFGFHTPGARFESILVSMPRLARWEYCHTPEPGSAEADLMEVLKNPRDWANK